MSLGLSKRQVWGVGEGGRRGKCYSSKLLSAPASFSSEGGMISTADSSPATDQGSDWFLSLPGENFSFSFGFFFFLPLHGQWFLRYFWLWFQPQRDITHHRTLLLLSWFMSPVLPSFLFFHSPRPYLSIFFYPIPSFILSFSLLCFFIISPWVRVGSRSPAGKVVLKSVWNNPVR